MNSTRWMPIKVGIGCECRCRAGDQVHLVVGVDYFSGVLPRINETKPSNPAAAAISPDSMRVGREAGVA